MCVKVLCITVTRDVPINVSVYHILAEFFIIGIGC